MDTKDTNKSTGSIKDFPTDYSDCQGCEKGMKFCQRPCWPTPEEAKRLIDAGYGDRLMVDFWAGSNPHMILCPANPGYESKLCEDYSMTEIVNEIGEGGESLETIEKLLKLMFGSITGSDVLKGCTFQNASGGCDLHAVGLKPFEGRRTCCKVDSQGIHEAVAMTWNNPEAQKLVEEWKSRFLNAPMLHQIVSLTGAVEELEEGAQGTVVHLYNGAYEVEFVREERNLVKTLSRSQIR